MTARRILVTGGTGFIGAALVRRLVRDGHRVRVLDNNLRGTPRRIADVASDVELVEADVRDADAVAQAARDIDRVVHLAAINGTEFFYSMPEQVLDVAVRGMLAVIDACRANAIGDLAVASSSEVYQSPPTVPTDETAPLMVPDVRNPRYSYGGGKIASELIAMNYGRTGFERVVVFRPHNVYGPDMGWEHVIPEFALRAGEAAAAHPTGPVPFEIQGDGSQTRAFVHIDDFTDGLVTVLDRGAHLGLYHIGDPEEVTIADLARRVVATLGREADVRTGDAPAGATARRCPDIAKLRALGFAPRVTLEAGLPATVAWYLDNADLRAEKLDPKAASQ